MERPKSIYVKERFNRVCTALTITLTGALMVFSVVILSPKPGLGSEQPDRREPSPEMMVDRLSETLQLSPDQQAAIAPVIIEEIRRRRELLDQHWADEEARRQELRNAMAEIDRETSDELATILSPEQLDQFSRLQERRKTRIASRREGRGGRHGQRPWSAREPQTPTLPD